MKRLFFELRYLFGDVPWDTGVSPPELLAFLDGHPPGRALDLGCGTGTNALTLARRGWEVTAIDFSSRALRAARRRFARAGMTGVLALGDVAEMAAASGQYDLVLDIGCFHSLTPQRRAKYAHSLSRHVGQGSTYLLYAFFTEDPSTAAHWPARDEIAATFADSLRLTAFAAGFDRQRPSAWFTFVARNP